MKQASVKLFLLVAELLAVVAICQFTVWTPPAEAAVVWLDQIPDEIIDPNQVDDPNGTPNPQPESVTLAGVRVWLDEEEPIDPNTPPESTNPQPEAAVGRPVAGCL